jgi:hypothetical protein
MYNAVDTNEGENIMLDVRCCFLFLGFGFWFSVKKISENMKIYCYTKSKELSTKLNKISTKMNNRCTLQLEPPLADRFCSCWFCSCGSV